MEYDLLLIDGYNLMHQEAPPGRGNLMAARQRLVRRIERGAPALAPRVVVVFDGRESGGSDPALDSAFLQVLFSPSGLSADGLIEQRVSQAGSPGRILVVTSDGVEQQVVSSAGAAVMSCREFLAYCDIAASIPPPAPTGRRRFRSSTLGDFFPESD